MGIETIVKIEENKNDIVGIRVNGTYYHVDYVDVDECGEFYSLSAYQIDENDLYIGYDFYREDLINETVQLFKLQLI